MKPNDKGLTAGEIFTNNFDTNGATGGDIVFAYNNLPYMFYDLSEDKFAFLKDVISNNTFSCLDLIETSDKRLKDNIEDVDEECSEIVKKIKVKTYKLKSDDEKKNHIGFIAQELVEVLPKKIEAVGNSDGDYMGINYGKMSAILWKCCQEQQSKIEHLEARLFEVEDIIKEMRGKGKCEAKPKPKAKQNQKQKM